MTDRYSTKDAEKDIFDYDSYIDQIEKDITNLIKYNDFLKGLGEVRSINYLLYGPPGTWKTSLIRVFASKLGCAVFIVNAGNIKVQQITGVLSTNKATEFIFQQFKFFKGKLHRFLTFHSAYDNNKAEEFLELVMKQNVTVRPFVNYVIRYLFEPDCLYQMIKNIWELK